MYLMLLSRITASDIDKQYFLSKNVKLKVFTKSDTMKLQCVAFLWELVSFFDYDKSVILAFVLGHLL